LFLTRSKDQPPTTANANKRLRPNALAEFEPRVGDLRVLYSIEDDEVILLIVGTKVGNTLVVNNEAFCGHQVDPPESAGSGSEGNTQ
jgi:hypothetical protein